MCENRTHLLQSFNLTLEPTQLPFHKDKENPLDLSHGKIRHQTAAPKPASVGVDRFEPPQRYAGDLQSLELANAQYSRFFVI